MEQKSPIEEQAKGAADAAALSVSTKRASVALRSFG